MKASCCEFRALSFCPILSLHGKLAFCLAIYKITIHIGQIHGKLNLTHSDPFQTYSAIGLN